jgi:hypothetical protein
LGTGLRVGVFGASTGTEGFSGVHGESDGGPGVSGTSNGSVGVDAKTQHGPAALRAVHAGGGLRASSRAMYLLPVTSRCPTPTAPRNSMWLRPQPWTPVP